MQADFHAVLQELNAACYEDFTWVQSGFHAHAFIGYVSGFDIAPDNV